MRLNLVGAKFLLFLVPSFVALAFYASKSMGSPEPLIKTADGSCEAPLSKPVKFTFKDRKLSKGELAMEPFVQINHDLYAYATLPGEDFARLIRLPALKYPDAPVPKFVTTGNPAADPMPPSESFVEQARRVLNAIKRQQAYSGQMDTDIKTILAHLKAGKMAVLAVKGHSVFEDIYDSKSGEYISLPIFSADRGGETQFTLQAFQLISIMKDENSGNIIDITVKVVDIETGFPQTLVVDRRALVGAVLLNR